MGRIVMRDKLKLFLDSPVAVLHALKVWSPGADTHRAEVANRSSNTVSVIDTVSNAVVSTG